MNAYSWTRCGSSIYLHLPPLNTDLNTSQPWSPYAILTLLLRIVAACMNRFYEQNHWSYSLYNHNLGKAWLQNISSHRSSAIPLVVDRLWRISSTVAVRCLRGIIHVLFIFHFFFCFSSFCACAARPQFIQNTTHSSNTCNQVGCKLALQWLIVNML